MLEIYDVYMYMCIFIYVYVTGVIDTRKEL